MNPNWKTLFIFLLFIQNKCIADTLPFKEKEQVDVIYKTSIKLKFDSCGVIFSNSTTNQLDTFFNWNNSNCLAVAEANKIELVRTIPSSFRVIYYFSDRVLTSTVLNTNGFKSYHRLLITDSGIAEITPIFKTPYPKYFAALLITILIELFVALIYFLSKKTKLINLFYIILINIITHPLLWLVSANVTGFAIGAIIGEPLVVIIEAWFLNKFIAPKLGMSKSMWFSFLLNVASFILGGLIFLWTVY